MTTLTPLAEVPRRFGLDARKALGQHFLLDEATCARVAMLAGDLSGRQVLEVGPGPGGLTRALLDRPLAHLTAVELDERALAALAELEAAHPGRLTVLRQDARRFDGTALPAPRMVVANLPYNVGTPLLIKWLTGPWTPCALTLMFQKEVAERVVAQPGEDAYGRLAVISQAVAEARIVMHLPAAAFTPPPKVASAVVHLIPFAERPAPDRLKRLERVTAAAFGQRRKMLRSSLKQLGGAALCEAAGIEPDARAETIDVAGFLRLADALT